jgi:hypothetical protein
MGIAYEPPGEAEHQELLRLLEEEIASVREEFAYAEKANEERAAIERDACLAPEGETWKMMLRQEAALDHSIDRKVRILLRLRKESTNPPTVPPDQDDGPAVGNMEEIVDSDIASDNSGSLIRDVGPGLAPARPPQGVALQSAEVVEDLKMSDRCGNVVENKGSRLDNQGSSANVTENKSSYAPDPGMLLKRKGVIGNAELRATSNISNWA